MKRKNIDARCPSFNGKDNFYNEYYLNILTEALYEKDLPTFNIGSHNREDRELYLHVSDLDDYFPAIDMSKGFE